MYFFIGATARLAGNDGAIGDVADSLSSNHFQIIMGLIALIATSIAALVYTIKNNSIGKEVSRNTSDINNAVNNVGPGDHRLYDMVAKIEAKQQEFERTWGNLPPELDDAVSLSETIHAIGRDLKRLDAKLNAHVSETNRKHAEILSRIAQENL